jgi:hypothetical protein
VFGQDRYVLQALAERRHLNAENVTD